MNLVQNLRRSGAPQESRYSLSQYVADLQTMFSFGGQQFLVTGGSTPPQSGHEATLENFERGVQSIYRADGVVAACIFARLLLFTEARFLFQDMSGVRPGELVTGRGLELLDRPWPGATTGELLARMEQDVSIAGNAYVALRNRRGRRQLRRLRPDWVTIVVGSMVPDAADAGPDDLDAELLGYLYYPGGQFSGAEPVVLLPETVAHYSPLPDPLAHQRGMSWITPVLREIDADQAATEHKRRFFRNGATINYVVSLDKDVSEDAFDHFKAAFEQSHQGTLNAYKTLFLGGGADVKTVGADMQQLEFKATQGAGEPLALDTPIPTPTGWTTMGDIKPGDQIVGRDGLPADVVGVSPVHYGRRCYRVTFNDRTSIVADADHLWAAMDRNTKQRSERIYTTEQMRDLIEEWSRRGNGGNRMGIAPAAPLKLPDVDLLVDPYVLGAWLGDGQTAGAAICGVPEDLSFIAAELERRGYMTTSWATAPDKAAVIGVPGGLLHALDALGVLNNKHIPEEYLRASVEQRLDLLRGLMDTDGTVGHVGREGCEFSSKFEHLARQVADLTRSLGIRVTVSRKVEPRSRTGETWRVQFRADPDMCPFLLPRKASRCVTPLWVRNRAVVSIEPVDSVPVRCIATNAPDGLFCAGEGWTLTHNTRIAAAAGVPPVIVGLSEGLAAATYSNYGMARRKFADHWARPHWRMAAAALETIVPPPAAHRLWYDDRDIAFLQEDAKDDAEIESRKASTIARLVDAGFNPDEVVQAVEAGDLKRLVGTHSGLFSVQLQPAGSQVDNSRKLEVVRDESGQLAGIEERRNGSG